MTQTVLLPGWENLSSEEKQLTEEWIKSILSARKASANILKLFGNKSSSDFVEKLDKILNQSDDFEIIESDTSVKLKDANDIVVILSDTCKEICNGDPTCEKNCDSFTKPS